MLTSIVPESSSISAVRAKVDIYNGATLVKTCTCEDFLQDFSLYREGDTSKFFGFGVVHRIVITFLDTKRELNINKGYHFNVDLGNGTIFDSPFASFYVAEVEREEKSNDLVCTAYDILQFTNNLLISEITLTAPYTLRDVVNTIAEYLGIEVLGLDETFDLSFPEGANFAGDETLREILNDVAEATQTIYYMNNENKLVFKRLDKTGEPVLTVEKKDYYELTTQTSRILSNICNVTELGDNVYSGDDTGVTQYVRDNPFWANRTDLGSLLNAAVARVAGTSITQLDCEWVGNYLLEIGDKVEFETEDGNLVYTYVLDDTIDFVGYLNQITSWEFTQEDGVTAANPTTIGEKLNQTFARVDKINKEITLMVSDVEEAKSITSALQVRTGEISASVKSLENKTDSSLNAVDNTISALAKEVNLKVSSDAVNISIAKALDEGVDKVKTSSKNYTFDDNGLNISSSDSEFNTTVDEDGMRIYKGSTEVLTANNRGVTATDLHARTFLIIGENSRLEDRGNRTACFWIGPAGG